MMIPPRFSKRRSQSLDMPQEQIVPMPFRQVYGEKVTTAFEAEANIAAHKYWIIGNTAPMRRVSCLNPAYVIPAYRVTLSQLTAFLIADGVFPKSPLPDSSFAAGHAHRRTTLSWRQGFGKPLFNKPPPVGEVIVTRWQRPDAMQMIGQNHPGIDMERPCFSNLPHPGSEYFDVPDE
jgi:hypothetical protein